MSEQIQTQVGLGTLWGLYRLIEMIRYIVSLAQKFDLDRIWFKDTVSIVSEQIQTQVGLDTTVGSE